MLLISRLSVDVVAEKTMERKHSGNIRKYIFSNLGTVTPSH